MSVSLSGVFNVQQFTDAGEVAAGHRLYTYSAGTTTHKVAYTDPDGLIPHTYVSDGIGGLYIALNSRGELPAPLFLSSGAYDLALKAPAGASVWTRRAIATAPQLADAAQGDALIAVQRTEAGSVAQTQHTYNQAAPLSVDSMGAAADGATDCTAAFTAARVATNGRYHLPGPGVYVVSATPNVLADCFTAGPSTSIRIGGNTYDVSNAIAGVWRLTVDSPLLMSLRHAVTGAIVQQWQNGAGGTATYFYRGLSVQTDSHSMQMGPATNGGTCDLLWQRSTLNADPAGNRFNITFDEANDRLQMSYATTASGAPAFDSWAEVKAGLTPTLTFPAIGAQFNIGIGVKQRAAGGFELQMIPTSSTVATIKQVGGSGTTFMSFRDGAMGFFGSSGTSRPTITGSRGGNVALANLLTQLATLGLITDSSTA